jgi:hypothetical protein
MKKVKKSVEIISLQESLFPVRIERTNEMIPGIITNSEYSRMVIGEVNGTDKLLNCCSPRYELVPNVTIFPEILRVLDANGITYSMEFSHINHARFYCNIVLEDADLAFDLGNGDVIKPRLQIGHSYNGLTKYYIRFGYFRLICENGLVVPLQEMKEYNLSIVGKHTESILRSFKQLDVLLHNLIENRKGFTAITKVFEVMNDTFVPNINDRIAEVAKASGIILVENSKFSALENIRLRAESEMAELNLPKINDWLLYNAFNQYINDDTINIKAPEIRAEIDTKVLTYMSRDIQR